MSGTKTAKKKSRGSAAKGGAPKNGAAKSTDSALKTAGGKGAGTAAKNAGAKNTAVAAKKGTALKSNAAPKGGNPPREKIHIDPAYTLELTAKLLCTCLVVAGLLALVNLITAPRIAELNWAKTVAAMRAVVADPENAEFSDALELSDDLSAAASGAGAQLSAVYPVSEGGADAGYAVTVVASGSQGNIEMMVGVDTAGVVTGVSVVTNSETPGIGSKVMGNEPTANGVGVLDQFTGKSAADSPLAVGSNVDAITGATVSTRGVAAGVNAALAVASALA